MPTIELVQRIQDGDGLAETLFYKRYQKGLLMMLEHKTRDRARAEDLMHDTMMIVLGHLRSGNVEQPEYLDRYVHQTAKFAFIGWLRKRDNQNELRETVDDVGHDQELIEDALSREETQAAVRRLIDEMKVPRDREILHRFYVLEQGKPVICEALDLSVIHFDRVINRARSRFRELIEGRLEQ